MNNDYVKNRHQDLEQMQQNNLSQEKLEYFDIKRDLMLNLKIDLHVTLRKPGSSSFQAFGNEQNGNTFKDSYLV